MVNSGKGKPIMKGKTRLKMAVSVFIAVSLFLTANFSDFFLGLNVVSGLIQITVNLFVFLSFKQGSVVLDGYEKTFATIFKYVPVIMAGITICHVLLPALLEFVQHTLT